MTAGLARQRARVCVHVRFAGDGGRAAAAGRLAMYVYRAKHFGMDTYILTKITGQGFKYN